MVQVVKHGFYFNLYCLVSVFICVSWFVMYLVILNLLDGTEGGYVYVAWHPIMPIITLNKSVNCLRGYSLIRGIQV